MVGWVRKVNKATWGRTNKGLMPKAYPLGYKKVTKRLQKGYKRVTKGLPKGYQMVTKDACGCSKAMVGFESVDNRWT